MLRRESARSSTSARRSGCAAGPDATAPRLAWLLMLALAFDTSTPMVSAAVVGSDDIPREGSWIAAPPAPLAQREVSAPNAQGESLAPLIDDVCRAAGVSLADLDVIGVGLGPGP